MPLCSPVSDLERKAQDASSVITPAELHGLVCGFASAGVQEFSMSDFVALAGADALSDEKAVEEFVSASLDALYAQDMEFSPLIPDDDEPLGVRLAGLSEWCAGYLSGFGAVAAGTSVKALPVDVQEILRDFASISGLDDEVEGDEQDENSFMEIYEYVRVAAVLTLTLMNDDAASDAGE